MSQTRIDELKSKVWRANLDLVKAGLVLLTWGNASAVDRETGVLAIKPSGVPYDDMRPQDMVLVSLDTGNPIDGERLNPSSDTPTHVCLYRNFTSIGAIVHTHSSEATSWAQACREIPCYGTTQADTFAGSVPLCRELTEREIEDAYEWNTGMAIVEHFRNHELDPLHVPGILLPHHAPFTWGRTMKAAVEHAIVIEEVAALATRTESLNPNAETTPKPMLTKHFTRKHGAGAYYGQPIDLC